MGVHTLILLSHEHRAEVHRRHAGAFSGRIQIKAYIPESCYRLACVECQIFGGLRTLGCGLKLGERGIEETECS